MNTKTKTEPLDKNSADFKNLVDLLAVFTEATNRLDVIATETNKELMDLLDEHRDDYAAAQKAASDAETALEAIALRHPEWFESKRSVTTPYGAVSFKASTKLEIPNEEATLARLELMAARNPEFKVANYVRTNVECDKETLAKLDDATLATLGIQRVPDDNFSVKPAKVKMGKALEAAAPEEQNSLVV
jgi:hypothetical protein